MHVGDRISILVTSFGCWCPTLMFKDRGCWRQKQPKPSPTSQSCHKHISSPTSVTKIDVAVPTQRDSRTITSLTFFTVRKQMHWKFLPVFYAENKKFLYHFCQDTSFIHRTIAVEVLYHFFCVFFQKQAKYLTRIDLIFVKK